jgi:GTP pyrophosphokinase
LSTVSVSATSHKSSPQAAPGAGPNGSSGLEQQLEQLLARLDARGVPPVGLERVRDAFVLARDAHQDQKRKSGEPYIIHPLAVAGVLVDLGLDADAIAAAFLHDVVEDTPVTDADLRQMFGEDVARLVRGVTKIGEIEARELPDHGSATREAAAEAESLRRLLLASVDDLRVLLIKLADRLHNMQTLGALSQAKRMRMARETLDVYAPLANRLGIWQFKGAFEDLALKELEPETVELIHTVLADRREAHEELLAEAMEELRSRLREAGLDAEIKSRAKHTYSIYRKMVRKDLDADQILDVLALRVMVDTIEQCYLVLGVVHAMWQPIEGEFDDYIGKKKPNLYQSLHTSVIGPGGHPLEVQIRTHEMDEIAEYGVAAHWMYKENASLSDGVQSQIAELRRTLEHHDEDTADAVSFVETLKTDVFRDQVYVFSPMGKVVELPAGATPIDFAYHIHTEVGHRCRGAEVNGRMVALDTPLETGQTVKIITAKGDEIGPSRDWANPSLGYVASHRANAKIGQWFRRQAQGKAMKSGREVLERQLRKLGMTRMKHDKVAKLFGHQKLEDFLSAVGRQEIGSQQITAKLLEHEADDKDKKTEPKDRQQRHELPTGQPKATAGVKLFGADSIQTRVARCCNPLPGEPVIGYMTRGRGVTLHRTNCRNIRAQREREPHRFIQVEWPERRQQLLPIELYIYAIDRRGLARDITDVISRNDVHLTGFGAISRNDDDVAIISAVVEVESHDQLVDLIDKLENVKNVIQVRRPRG